MDRNLESLRGIETQEKFESKDAGKLNIEKEQSGNCRSGPPKILAEEIVKQFNEGKLVYCRFGRQYVTMLDRQINSLIGNTQNPVSTSLRSATYLINVKKLIKDHNIESDHNFAKLKTKNNIQKGNDMPPMQFYTLENDNDLTLIFESRFESGNLLSAWKVSDNEYDLIL